MTPSLGAILAGITRETVMTLAKGQNIQVIEKKITVQEALDADEAFFTGTAAAVTPIRSINDTK
jgi:branched-chain amino acid aminotransferase